MQRVAYWKARKSINIGMKIVTQNFAFLSVGHRLTAYAKFLAQDEDLSRLDELCIDLLGPVHAYVIS